MNNLASVSNVQSETSEMPNVVKRLVNEVTNPINNDFISHPQQYPFEIKRLRRWPLKNWSWSKRGANSARVMTGNLDSESQRATVGLRIYSEVYFETNTQVQISIPLRGEAQYFIGTVVLVRELSDGFEIGLWLANQEDEARARIVEKICHAECGLQTTSKTPKINEHRGRKSKTDNGWLDVPGKTPLRH